MKILFSEIWLFLLLGYATCLKFKKLHTQLLQKTQNHLTSPATATFIDAPVNPQTFKDKFIGPKIKRRINVSGVAESIEKTLGGTCTFSDEMYNEDCVDVKIQRQKDKEKTTYTVKFFPWDFDEKFEDKDVAASVYSLKTTRILKDMQTPYNPSWDKTRLQADFGSGEAKYKDEPEDWFNYEFTDTRLYQSALKGFPECNDNCGLVPGHTYAVLIQDGYYPSVKKMISTTPKLMTVESSYILSVQASLYVMALHTKGYSPQRVNVENMVFDSENKRSYYHGLQDTFPIFYPGGSGFTQMPTDAYFNKNLDETHIFRKIPRTFKNTYLEVIDTSPEGWLAEFVDYLKGLFVVKQGELDTVDGKHGSKGMKEKQEKDSTGEEDEGSSGEEGEHSSEKQEKDSTGEEDEGSSGEEGEHSSEKQEETSDQLDMGIQRPLHANYKGSKRKKNKPAKPQPIKFKELNAFTQALFSGAISKLIFRVTVKEPNMDDIKPLEEFRQKVFEKYKYWHGDSFQLTIFIWSMMTAAVTKNQSYEDLIAKKAGVLLSFQINAILPEKSGSKLNAKNLFADDSARSEIDEEKLKTQSASILTRKIDDIDDTIANYIFPVTYDYHKKLSKIITKLVLTNVTLYLERRMTPEEIIVYLLENLKDDQNNLQKVLESTFATTLDEVDDIIKELKRINKIRKTVHEKMIGGQTLNVVEQAWFYNKYPLPNNVLAMLSMGLNPTSKNGYPDIVREDDLCGHQRAEDTKSENELAEKTNVVSEGK